MKNRRVLVSGSAGFIGKHLISRLKENGADVIGIDITHGTDITKWNHIQEIKDFDILYHLAAMMFVPFAYKDPRRMYHVNIIGTLNMLELCRQNDAKMIFASSYVYGIPEYLPIDEGHPVKAVNPYGRSKIIGEELCKGYYQDHEVNTIIVRPFNIYGYGQNDQFLIPQIINQARSGKIKLKDPEPKRDFINVHDVIEAYMRIGQYINNSYNVFNIGSGISYSVKEIAEMIRDYASKQLEREITIEFTGEKRKQEIYDTVANITKALELLNWKPKIDISTGLNELVKDLLK